MRKRNIALALTLTALSLTCLSGCGGKKADNETTQAPLETIAPDDVKRADGDINDKLEDPADSIEIEGYLVGPDGKVLTGEEAIAYEEEMIYGIKHDEESDQSAQTSNQSDQETSGQASDQSNQESGTVSESASAYGSESLQAESSTSESISESLTESQVNVDVASDQRDFTEDEYEKLQQEIDEWTYQEAIKRMGGQ